MAGNRRTVVIAGGYVCTYPHVPPRHKAQTDCQPAPHKATPAGKRIATVTTGFQARPPFFGGTPSCTQLRGRSKASAGSRRRHLYSGRHCRTLPKRRIRLVFSTQPPQLSHGPGHPTFADASRPEAKARQRRQALEFEALVQPQDANHRAAHAVAGYVAVFEHAHLPSVECASTATARFRLQPGRCQCGRGRRCGEYVVFTDHGAGACYEGVAKFPERSSRPAGMPWTSGRIVHHDAD